MKPLTKITLAFFALTATLSANAQMEGTLYNMSSLPQVVVNNPAFVPRYKFTLGLPAISSFAVGYSNNGFSYSDLLSNKNGVVSADLSKLVGSLTDKNYITQTSQVDLLRLGLKIKSLYLTASITGKTYNRLMLPKDFVSLFIGGNTQYVGTTANFSLQGESLSYIESALGASLKLTDRLTIGGRLKYLKGITNATTDVSNISVAVSDTYQVTTAADVSLKTSGIYAATQSGFKLSNSYSNYLNNNGVALDLGATIKITDKLSVAASLIDIGQISWSNNTYQYSLNKSSATYTFEGVDIQKVVKGNTDYFPGLADTLQNKFKFKETSIGSYSTVLPSKIYLSGNYELIKNLNVGAVFYSETFRGRTAAGWTGSVNKQFGHLASLSISYTVAERSANNLGAGLSLNFAPFQFYLVGDNLLNAPISIISSQNLNGYINNTKYFNLRTGINFVFGRDRGTVETAGGPHEKSGKKYNDNKKRKPGNVPSLN